jgi:hypothetical protein
MSIKSFAAEVFFGAVILAGGAALMYGNHKPTNLDERIECGKTDLSLTSALQEAAKTQDLKTAMEIKDKVKRLQSGEETGYSCKMTSANALIKSMDLKLTVTQ